MPVNLIVPVEQLCANLDRHVRTGAWADLAMAACGIWQATDDALAATPSLLNEAVVRARRRFDPGTGWTSRGLDVALRAALSPAGSTGRGRTSVDDWRSTLMEVAVEAAGLVVLDPDADGTDERVRRVSHLVARLAGPPPTVRSALTRIPSSFRAFDQHPDDVAELVRRFVTRWPDRDRPLVVVGVRTSGSYLAPFAVELLRRAGFADVAMVSARPSQWYLQRDEETLREAGRRGAMALVIDDPPHTGRDVARVCAELGRFGIPPASTVPVLALFDERGDPPEPLSAYAAVTLAWPEWSIHRRIGPEETGRFLDAALSPATVTIERELPAPPTLPRAHARRLYRVAVTEEDGAVSSRAVLAVGTGLGYFGDHDVAVGSALKGHVPAVLGHVDGVLYLDWPHDAQEVLPPAEDVIDYVRARHDSLGVDDDPSERLAGSLPAWEVGSNHLAQVWGRFWPVARVLFVGRLTRRLLRTPCPSVTDGDMRPANWLVGTGTERPMKTSFSERSFSNFDLASFDDRFDVVGAAVHTDDAGYSGELRATYAERTGRRISPERWLVYELVHLWDLERLAGATPETTKARKAQAVRRYLAETLLPDVDGGASSTDGPIVALDVDGVLETDLLGFRAPSPTSVLCLRALHAHGYRTVLATGRSLDDVVAMSEVFGLAGGTAEYGSVVYDHRAASVTPLVTDGELAELGRLRESLRLRAGVRVDDRHRFSVRASNVDDRQRLGALPWAALPEGLRAIAGDEQTDVVTARLDKADGVRALVERLGGEPPVLAVGDTASDVGLLGCARTSVVPRHADGRAKAAATRVARHAYQGGLADAVGGLIGHRPGNCPRCAAPDMTIETRTMLQLLRVPEGSRLQALLRAVPLLRTDPRGDR
ncbi:MAG: HAD family hydrolase, partial [Blastococcus sp.]